MFTIYYFIVFSLSLVILSHSSLHYTTRYVATFFLFFILFFYIYIHPRCFYILQFLGLLIGDREVHPGLHFTPQYVG